jgi:hypothetical protein
VTARTLDEIWDAHLVPTAVTTCAGSGCHSIGEGDLGFATAHELWQATVERPSFALPDRQLVTPGKPMESELYLRLAGLSPEERMPSGGPYLDDAALAEVAGWICSGAPAPVDAGPANPAPILESIAPQEATAGSSVVLVVTGRDFIEGATIVFDGITQATVRVDASRLQARLSGSDLPTAREVQVRVHNPAPGGGLSAARTFTVRSALVVPRISGLSPCGVVADGREQSVVVTGTGFLEGMTATLSGTEVPVELRSSTEAVLNLPASLLASAPASRAHAVVLANPSPAGGPSLPVTFGVAASEVSFSTEVQPIFTATCAGSGCHSRSSAQIDLTSGAAHASLVGVASAAASCSPGLLVQACNPTRAGSVLVDKLLATTASPACAGTRMPKTGSLTTAEIDRIRDWIAQGARP